MVAGSAHEEAAGCHAVLATLRFSTSLLCGHCISCQLMGTICTPARRTAHMKLAVYHGAEWLPLAQRVEVVHYARTKDELAAD